MSCNVSRERLCNSLAESAARPHMILTQEVTEPRDVEFMLQKGHHICMQPD